MAKLISLLTLALLTTIALVGCDLVFEPPEAAVDRLMRDLVGGDRRVAKEMAADEEVRQQIVALEAILSGPLYRNVADVWEVTLVEKDEAQELVYTYLTLKYPPSIAEGRTTELVFEMERIRLRWVIYDVSSLNTFVKDIQRRQAF